MEKTPAQAFAEKFNVCLDEASYVRLTSPTQET